MRSPRSSASCWIFRRIPANQDGLNRTRVTRFMLAGPTEVKSGHWPRPTLVGVCDLSQFRRSATIVLHHPPDENRLRPRFIPGPLRSLRLPRSRFVNSSNVTAIYISNSFLSSCFIGSHNSACNQMAFQANQRTSSIDSESMRLSMLFFVCTKPIESTCFGDSLREINNLRRHPVEPLGGAMRRGSVVVNGVAVADGPARVAPDRPTR